jgi:hypothetical protein
MEPKAPCTSPHHLLIIESFPNTPRNTISSIPGSMDLIPTKQNKTKQNKLPSFIDRLVWPIDTPHIPVTNLPNSSQHRGLGPSGVGGRDSWYSAFFLLANYSQKAIFKIRRGKILKKWWEIFNSQNPTKFF